MADTFIRYSSVSQQSFSKFIFACLRLQLAALWSVGIWALWETKLLSATGENTHEVSQTEGYRKVSSSPLQYASHKKFTVFGRQESKNLLAVEDLTPPHPALCPLLSQQIDILSESYCPHPYRLTPKPFLLAAPENFNPDLRVLPPPPKPPKPQPPETTTQPVKPAVVLENIQTDFRSDTDNYGLDNLFIEPTIQFRLRNGNKLRFKTGYDFFQQSRFQSVTNVPFQVGWEGKLKQVTVQTAVGVDFFDRLPSAINLNAKVETQLGVKTSSSGQLLSGVTLSANLEHGPSKFNVRTLERGITSWRYGPDLFWQIDRNTSLFSSLRLGNYNDGNFEVQSFTRLERKFGQFSVAGNLFNWSYDSDRESRSGYFSPPDFLVYNGEIGWEGDIAKFLRCRLAASFGQQRLKGEFDNANTYQTRCTVKVSPSLEADLGYTFSNVRNQNTGASGYGGNSLVGQLRIKF